MLQGTTCAKCGKQNEPESEYCVLCYTRFTPKAAEKPAEQPRDYFGSDPFNALALFVQQNKEWGEVLTGFETENKYSIVDSSGQEILRAAEESSFLSRMFFKNFRPFTIHVLNREGRTALKLVSPFRFLFSEVTVFDGVGSRLGSVTKELSLLRPTFSVKDRHNRQIFTIVNPLLQVWTYNIYKGDSEVGTISKKWSGFVKEMISDADNFSINFPPESTPEQRKILLGALFLIDMKHFESKD